MPIRMLTYLPMPFLPVTMEYTGVRCTPITTLTKRQSYLCTFLFFIAYIFRFLFHFLLISSVCLPWLISPIHPQQLFQGNTDGNAVVINRFDPPIIAQFIRINPTRWRDRISMRLQLYGCDYRKHHILKRNFSFTVNFTYPPPPSLQMPFPLILTVKLT